MIKPYSYILTDALESLPLTAKYLINTLSKLMKKHMSLFNFISIFQAISSICHEVLILSFSVLTVHPCFMSSTIIIMFSFSSKRSLLKHCSSLMFIRVSLFIIILKLVREFSSSLNVSLETFMSNYFRQSTQMKHILVVSQIVKGYIQSQMLSRFLLSLKASDVLQRPRSI